MKIDKRKEPYINVVIIDQDGAKQKKIRNGLKTFKKILQCDRIDIIERYTGDYLFDFVIDDEGALIDGNKASGYCMDAVDMIYGNMIICGCGAADGQEHGLSDEEINAISHFIIEGGGNTRLLPYFIAYNCHSKDEPKNWGAIMKWKD